MTKPEADKNYFGKFLSELRTSRGFANINEYLRRYPLPMSHVHYRHLESGNRKIGIESAKEMSQALQADPRVFYYYLLKDSLADDVMDCFSVLSEEAGASTNSQAMNTLTADSEILFPSKECCAYLNEHFELMPVIWLVYSAPSVTLKDVAVLLERLNIAESAEEVILTLEKHGIVRTQRKIQGSNENKIERLKPSISFLHDRLGMRILQEQTETATNEYLQSPYPAVKDSVLIYNLMCLSDEDRQIVFERIKDFAQEAHRSAAKCKDSESSEPVFFSVVYAPRPEYRVDNDDEG